MIDPEFAAFARCWNDERFFEAHEVLEGLWNRTRDPGQRGLIQLAAALHHVQRGNLRGARTMVRRSLGRMREGAAAAHPFDRETLIAYAETLDARLASGGGADAIAARPRL